MKESRLQAAIITSIGGFIIRFNDIFGEPLMFLGFLLLLWGKPKLGLLIEIFGLLNLFG